MINNKPVNWESVTNLLYIILFQFFNNLPKYIRYFYLFHNNDYFVVYNVNVHNKYNLFFWSFPIM